MAEVYHGGGARVLGPTEKTSVVLRYSSTAATCRYTHGCTIEVRRWHPGLLAKTHEQPMARCVFCGGLCALGWAADQMEAGRRLLRPCAVWWWPSGRRVLLLLGLHVVWAVGGVGT